MERTRSRSFLKKAAPSWHIKIETLFSLWNWFPFIFKFCAPVQSGSIFRDLKIGSSHLLVLARGRKHTSGFNFSVRFQEEGKFNLPPIYRTEWNQPGAKAEEDISFAKNMQIFDYLGMIRRMKGGTDWAEGKQQNFNRN